MIDWRREFAGSKRLELTLASPRPAQPTFRVGTLFLPLPTRLLDRVTAEANRLATTPDGFAIAAIDDALRAVPRADVPRATPIRPPRHASLAQACGVLALLWSAFALPDQAPDIVLLFRRWDRLRDAGLGCATRLTHRGYVIYVNVQTRGHLNVD